MKRPNLLLIQSAVIGSVLVTLALGGLVSSARLSPSSQGLDDPVAVPEQYDLGALALYYNATLADLGTYRFSNASFLLGSFSLVNIPPSLSQTAAEANSDLLSLNSTIPAATLDLNLTEAALATNEYLNATSFAISGCEQARLANQSLEDFQVAQTAHLRSLSVPTSLYSVGESLAVTSTEALLASCSKLQGLLPTSTGLLTISSPQMEIETGRTVSFAGTLTVNGSGPPGQQVLFYIDGVHFGSLLTGPSGELEGALSIPFLYKPSASVQAVVAPNATLAMRGTESNELNFIILFNQTSIALADPSAYLPTQSFQVFGNLTTTSGVPLPDAPVNVSFAGESFVVATDLNGRFSTTLTVPSNATDGTYSILATFAPQGTFGPSSDLTSISVTHLPLDLVVYPRLSFAGLPSELTGRASANGTSVSGAHVLVGTPWGSYNATTNSLGQFSVSLTVSPSDFSFEGALRVAATAPEPFVAPGTASASLPLFNPLIVVLPAVTVATATYEARMMGVFAGRRGGRERVVASREALGTPAEDKATTSTHLAEPLAIYREALGLASIRFGLRFGESETIREVLSQVNASGRTEGYAQFERISLAAEDFLYSRSFDSSRGIGAREDLGSLEALWR